MYFDILCADAPLHAAGALIYFFHPCPTTGEIITHHTHLDIPSPFTLCAASHAGTKIADALGDAHTCYQLCRTQEQQCFELNAKSSVLSPPQILSSRS